MEVIRRTFTVAEAAVCLGVSRNTAYQAIHEGTLPAIRIGRRILVPIHALDAFLSEATACGTGCN